MRSLDEIVAANAEGAHRLPPAKVFANTVVESRDLVPDAAVCSAMRKEYDIACARALEVRSQAYYGAQIARHKDFTAANSALDETYAAARKTYDGAFTTAQAVYEASCAIAQKTYREACAAAAKKAFTETRAPVPAEPGTRASEIASEDATKVASMIGF